VGFVLILTILTFYSVPILEAIFGNGMVEGEDPDAWWKEIEPRTNSNPSEDEQVGEEVNNSETQKSEEVSGQLEESFDMEALPTDSNHQVTVEAQVVCGEAEEEESKV